MGKYDGKWLRPLKFLGLTYDGKSLRADTRKGSTLVANNKRIELGLINWSKFRSKGVSQKATFESLTKSHIWGYIQSRLYSGEWNLDNISQDFLYKIWKLPEGSWGKRFYSKKHTLHNTGSYATYSLIKILTNDERSKKIALNLK